MTSEKSFQYRVRRFDHANLEEAEDWLNVMGAQGWSLTAITAVGGSAKLYYFQRPVDD
jgi:hypothetical protein